MIRPFFQADKTNLILQAALNGYSARHEAIVNNIANVDTLGYHRIQVSFEDELQKAREDLETRRGIGSPADGGRYSTPLAGFRPRVGVDKSLPIRADGSNVSIDREMAELAKNGQKLLALTELMIREDREIRSAIRGRNG